MAEKKVKTAAVIVAAGNSTRMGAGVSKQFLQVGGMPVLARTLRAFEAAAEIGEIVLVTRAADLDAATALVRAHGIGKCTAVVEGGETRAASVRNGFLSISPAARYVAVHDGARCLITPAAIDAVCRAAYRHRAASAARPVSDTVKIADRRGFIRSTVPRETVFLATTPQVFDTRLYRAALELVKDAADLTDDNQLAERIGYPVKLVDCGEENIKITRPGDVALAEWLLQRREKTP